MGPEGLWLTGDQLRELADIMDSFGADVRSAMVAPFPRDELCVTSERAYTLRLSRECSEKMSVKVFAE